MSALFSAFDRIVASDVGLALLGPPRSEHSALPLIRISTHSTPVEPLGPPIGGSDHTGLTMFRHGDDTALALNGTGWVALLREGLPEINLHPDARLDDPSVADSARRSRVLGDRLVTSVVPYLPSTWGDFGFHASLLTGPMGGLVLLGESGFGKSTLSQYLQRDGQWKILDDDTSLIYASRVGELVPLGALARLRDDAAAQLGVAQVALPGHGDGKGALAREVSDRDTVVSVRVHRIVQLAPKGSRLAAGDSPVIEVSAVSPARAVGNIFEGLMSISLDRKETIQRQFSLAAKWASIPHYLLSYDKSLHGARETASVLHRFLEKW